MSLSIVIPVRPPEEGKSRLAGALGQTERAALVERMFAHVLAAALAVPGARVQVVSRSAHLLALAEASGARGLRETGEGLNPALEQAAALADPVAPLLALSADLPLLAPGDLAALLAELAATDVAAATDRAGTGTNALLLRRPGLIAYAFGAGSLARHEAAARAAGQRFTTVRRPGLAADLDEPADLALLAAAGAGIP